jgi:hypothetical protein
LGAEFWHSSKKNQIKKIFNLKNPLQSTKKWVFWKLFLQKSRHFEGKKKGFRTRHI